MTEAPEREMTSRLIAWCPNGRFHDGEWTGPKHACPAWDCIGIPTPGKPGHLLRKRRAWLCSRCDTAFFSRREAEEHDCDDTTP